MAKRIIIIDPLKVKKKNTLDFWFTKRTKEERNRFSEEEKEMNLLELRNLHEKILTVKKINPSGGYTHYTGRLVDEDQKEIYLLDPDLKISSSSNQEEKQIHLDYLKTTCLVRKIEKKDIKGYSLI